MIKNSFIFLEKISKKKEQSIWKQGIKDWNGFLNAQKIKGVSSLKKSYYNQKIREAQQTIVNNDSSFFIHKLPATEMWRLYDYFKEEACFLDIEVDSYGKVIVVGVSDYYQTNIFVKGVNVERTVLEKELSTYKLIITFNGAAFDLPKLKKQVGLEMAIPHIDLKPLCVNLGLRGGLKEIELKLNLKRPVHLKGSPVDLWKAFHASGDREYLELLIEYNKEDCENLKAITNYIYKQYSNKIYKLLNNSEA